jgi:hypothetical protein
VEKIKVKRGRGSPMVMHKGEMRREQQSRMKWFLNFLNMDINSLNSVELLKLLLDFGVFIYGRRYFELIEKKDFKTKKGLIQEKIFLKVCQDFFRCSLDGFLSEDERHRGRFDTMIVAYFVDLVNDKIRRYPVHHRFHLLVADLPKHLDEEGEQGNICRGILQDAFFVTLSPFPVSRIRICQKRDCGKYFYQKTTKSKGDFCSRKCQNYASNERWRKANPEKYNASVRAWRKKAKEPWIKMTCLNCGHEYPKGHLDPITCSKCRGNLKFAVQFLEGGEWKSEQCRDFDEAEELRKEILEFEKDARGAKNGKR